jgi:hypothetical protein
MDVHAPHAGLNSWKDFWIHLGTITIGLLIALSLEQSVEWVHHQHQRRQLENDVHDELRSNLPKDAYTFRQLALLRAYLVELKAAVDAQHAGKLTRTLAALDPRRRMSMIAPSMASWQAAKESGTLALLPSDEIKLYNRFLLQFAYREAAIEDFQQSSFAEQSFEERFGDAPGAFDLGDAESAPDLSSMPAVDLEQYSVVLAKEIKALDRLHVRLKFVDVEDRVLLNGANTEDELVQQTIKVILGPEGETVPLQSGSNAASAPGQR